MRHLTPDDYRRMPWANGRGTTVEMMRVDGPGGLLWRLSMAQVVEDGPFSLFPGIERNLTVISGPGFDLTGDMALRADPLVPVAFPGDIALRAVGVVAPCDDVNVMTARHLPLPQVLVLRIGAELAPRGLLCLFALAPTAINGRPMRRHDLCLAQEPVAVTGKGAVLAAQLFLQGPVALD